MYHTWHLQVLNCRFQKNKDLYSTLAGVGKSNGPIHLEDPVRHQNTLQTYIRARH